jgi:Protein of unknown function (DUF4435)
MDARTKHLRSERESATVILQRILKDIGKDPLLVVCCFEGKDSGYYGVRIKTILSQLPTGFYNCFGKTNLRKIYHLLNFNEALTNIRMMFFFDRDYDNELESLDAERCYITDGYSVENYYTSDSAFKAIIRSAFFGDHIYTDEDEACIQVLTDMYDRFFREFHCKIKLFNYWAWVHRKVRPEAEGRINLSEIDKGELVTVQLGSIAAAYSLATLNAQFPDRRPAEQEELDKAVLWFETRNRRLAFRGKQESRFFSKLINTLVERAAKGISPFKKKLRPGIRVSYKEFVDDLSQFADTPVSLQEFLQKARS